MNGFFAVLVLILSGIVSWLDLKTKRVPIRMLQMGIGGAFIFQLVQGSWLNALVASVLGFTILFLPAFFSKGRLLGEGDAWVGAWMGMVLGIPELWVSFYGAILLGGVVALVLLCRGWKRTDRVPFAPILCGSLFFTLLWGQMFLTWFQHWF